jgi:hypothetical protein
MRIKYVFLVARDSHMAKEYMTLLENKGPFGFVISKSAI